MSFNARDRGKSARNGLPLVHDVQVGGNVSSNRLRTRVPFSLAAASEPTGSPRIPSLDGLRALSIGLVLLAHLRGTSNAPDLTWIEMFGDIGNLGVRFFFVISGFLITLLLYRELARTGRVSLVGFLRRRAFRILPAFAVYVGAIAVMATAGIIVVDSGDFMSALTFTANFDAHRSWYIGHLWSLAVEEQFYLCWPVVLAVVGRSRMFWVGAGACALGPLARVSLHLFAPEHRWAIGESFPTVIDALACGSLLATLHDRLAANRAYLRWLRSRALIAAPLALIALNAEAAHVAFSYSVGQTLMNVLIALILHRVVLFPDSFAGRLLNARPIVALGVISYSLYLWQQPFLNRQSDHLMASFPVNVALAIGAAILSYRVVEQPLLRIGRRFGTNRVAASEPRKTRTGAVCGGMFLASQLLALNVLGLFSTAYIISHLGALRYGQWATAAALTALHVLLTTVALRPVFIRNIARRPEDARELLAEQLALRLALGALGAASAITIALALRYPPVVIACVAVGSVWIMLSVISATLGDLLQALEHFTSYSVTSIISGLTVTAASVAVVHQGYGPVGLSLAYLTAPAVNALVYWRIASRHVQVGVRWDFQRAKALLRESRFVAFSQIAAAARDRAEQLLVPSLAGLEAFGILSAGAMVADRLGNVPDAICTAFYPRISRAAQGNVDGLVERNVTTMLTIGLAVSVPLAIVGTYLATSIAQILLPASSDLCRTVIQVSVWAVPLLAISFGMSFSLQAAGHHEEVAKLGLRATGISVIVSVVLIAAFGITGASWTLLARPAIVAIALSPLFRRTFPAVLARVPVGRILVSTAALAGTCLLTDRHRIVPALVFVVLGIGVYGVALLASRVVPMSVILRLVARPVSTNS